MFLVYGYKYILTKHRLAQQGVCPHCDRSTVLESALAWKWFSLFFVPIFPMAKAVVHSYCKHCNELSTIQFRNWHKDRKATLASISEDLHFNFDMPKALELYEYFNILNDQEAIKHMDNLFERLVISENARADSLVAWYHQHLQFKKAKDFATQCLQRSPDYPWHCLNLMNNTLVSWSELEALNIPAIIRRYHWQNYDLLRAFCQRLIASNNVLDTYDHFEQLNCLCAGDSVATVGLAHSYMARKFHDNAFDLVKQNRAMFFSESPFVIKMADFYFQNQQFAKAYELFGIVLAASSNHLSRQLIKKIRATEKALKLKKRRISNTAVILTVLIFGVIPALAVFGSSYYLSQNQTLHIANMLPSSITITLDDTDGYSILPHQIISIALTEGPHSLNCSTGSYTIKDTITIRNDFFERYFGDKVFLYNAFKAGIPYKEIGYYTINPNYDPGQTITVYLDQSFLEFSGIAKEFQELPETIEDDDTGIRTIVAVNILSYTGQEDQIAALKDIGVSQERLDSFQQDYDQLIKNITIE